MPPSLPGLLRWTERLRLQHKGDPTKSPARSGPSESEQQGAPRNYVSHSAPRSQASQGPGPGGRALAQPLGSCSSVRSRRRCCGLGAGLCLSAGARRCGEWGRRPGQWARLGGAAWAGRGPRALFGPRCPRAGLAGLIPEGGRPRGERRAARREGSSRTGERDAEVQHAGRAWGRLRREGRVYPGEQGPLRPPLRRTEHVWRPRTLETREGEATGRCAWGLQRGFHKTLGGGGCSV